MRKYKSEKKNYEFKIYSKKFNSDTYRKICN